MRLTLLLTILFAIQAPVSAQQNFSCNYGARGACLGYNDKIVDRSSACFSEFTCDFKGFVCKAKFDDVIDEYDTLVRKHNDLVRRDRELADTTRELLDKNSTLTTEYNNLLLKFRTLALEYETQAEELRSANERNAQLAATVRSPAPRSNSAPVKEKRP